MQKSSGNPRLFCSMADRRGTSASSERVFEGADEILQSTDSSGMSLSFEHQNPEVLDMGSTSTQEQPGSLPTLDLNILDSFLIGDMDSDSIREPSLEITEQPRAKDLRFRYECEGRSAGSLLGIHSNNDRKSYPTVKIKNYTGRVKIIASLVTRQEPHKLHPNSLVGKTCKNGVCTQQVDVSSSQVVSFPNLGIQCAKKKDIHSALQERRKLGLDPFQQKPGASRTSSSSSSSTDYEMSVVCLCFQAFLDGQLTRPLPPIVSNPIHDKKGASLTISRVDRNSGTVTGGEEMFILCDKVNRDDIEVIFSHDSWEGNAVFGPSDIHRQVAIVCKTPPFKDTDIDKPVTVQFRLRRKSDRECSEPREFIYKPVCLDADRIEAKRRKKSPLFSNFLRGPDQIKQEPVAQPCDDVLMAFQQQQQKKEELELQQQQQQQLQLQQQQQQQQHQQQSNMGKAGATGSAVKEALRNKIKQTNERDPVSRPVTDGRHPPQRDLLQAAGDRAAPSTSTFCYNHSALSFGTVTQREQVGAGEGAAGAGPGPMDSFGSPPPDLPAPGPILWGAAGASQAAAAVAVEYIDGNSPFSDALASIGAILTDDSFTSLLQAEGIDLQAAGIDLQAPGLTELTTLESFNPSSLSLNGALGANLTAEQAVPDYTMEDVTDSVSIPYSVSVDIEHELNPNSDSNTNG